MLSALAVLVAAGACERQSSTGGDDAPGALVRAQEEGDDDAGGSSPRPDCVAAFRALYGEEGCVPGAYNESRIDAACATYDAWANGVCASGVLSDFFRCLEEISCDVFEEDAKPSFTHEYERCRVQFAKEMDICIQAENG